MAEVKTVESTAMVDEIPQSSWSEARQDDRKEIPRDDPRAITPASDYWVRDWCVYAKQVDESFYYRPKTGSSIAAQDRVRGIGLEFRPSIRHNSIGIKLTWNCKFDLGWGLKQGWTDPKWGINLNFGATRREKYACDFYEGHSVNQDNYSLICLYVANCSLERLGKILSLHCQVCDIDLETVQVLEECYKRGLARAQVSLRAMVKERQICEAKYAQELHDREAKNALAATVETTRRQVAEVSRNVTIKAMWEKYRKTHGTSGYPAPEYYTNKWLPRLTQTAIDHFIKTGEI